MVNIPKFKFVHNNISVSDLERSLKFYEEALGLKEVNRLEFENLTLVYLGDEFGSEHKLELRHVRNRKAPYDIGGAEIFHFAFTTDDFKAAHELHEKLGCIGVEVKDLGIYFIQDPDGYWIEIMPVGWRNLS